MKKTLLAAVIPSLLVSSFAAQAVNIHQSEAGSVDFYGQLRAQFLDSDHPESALSKSKLEAGSSRAGIAVDFNVDENLRAIGKAEFGLYAGSSDLDLYSRLHYVGLAGDFGQVTMGRQWTVADDFSGADFTYFYGGDALRYKTLNDGLHSSLIKYVYESEGFKLAANYGVEQEATKHQLIELYVAKEFGDFLVHVGAGRDTAKEYELASGDKVNLRNTYAEVTAEYAIAGGVVAATYYAAKQEKLDSTPEQSIDEGALSLSAKLPVAEKTSIYTGFEYTVQEKSTNSDKDDLTYGYVGGEYKFNQYARVYGEYGYKKGESQSFTTTGINTSSNDGEGLFALGARIYF
ncbi:porin [Vibrio sp. SCSIO 43136]|uniref:porin n=1 Tax=Vibrio sp. SCSIO 43136 TaxID=2819101 RepID=UPI00207589AE|nr:porin [Vibrio sp. SCSIO 43136]USD67299.1 porin [Vibrio sp. SCSIO 43136]